VLTWTELGESERENLKFDNKRSVLIFAVVCLLRVHSVPSRHRYRLTFELAHPDKLWCASLVGVFVGGGGSVGGSNRNLKSRSNFVTSRSHYQRTPGPMFFSGKVRGLILLFGSVISMSFWASSYCDIMPGKVNHLTISRLSADACHYVDKFFGHVQVG
jgi:hypothetical protein